MKFNRTILSNILAIHQSNLDKKAIDPVFCAINLKIQNNFLHIISTDMQRYLENIIEYIKQDQSIFINGLLLYEIIKKSQSEEFQIIDNKENKDSYTILIDNAEFKISQTIRNISSNWTDHNTQKFSIKANILSSSIQSIKWAASLDESRPALTGVCFDFDNNCLNLCATDGLKLATTKIFDNYNITGRWILGKKSINDLLKILDECESNDVHISFGDHFTLEYEKKDQKIIWKSLFVLDTFPPYQKILAIENQFNTEFSIHSKTILNIIDRIMIASNQNQPTLIFHFKAEDNCLISSENTVLTGFDILPINYTGPNIKISLNGRFLQEMFSNISNDTSFFIKDPFSPIAVKPKNNLNTIFIIAPIKPNF